MATAHHHQVKEIEVKEIVRSTRARQNLSLAQFGRALGVTRQAIYNWERGINRPDPMLLIKLTIRHSDWRADFARECLITLKPELFEAPE